MKTSKMYRFEIRVNNVYDYLADKFASLLNTSDSTISGWIREDMINDLRSHFSGMEIKLIENYK